MGLAHEEDDKMISPSTAIADLYCRPKQVLRLPFSQMLTDIDEIWQITFVAQNTLVWFHLTPIGAWAAPGQ